MDEVGVDITHQESVRLTPEMLEWADIVVTVCGHADEQCPTLPAGKRKEHWPLDNPATATGTEKEIMETFRNNRDDIKYRVQELIKRLGQESKGSGKQ